MLNMIKTLIFSSMELTFNILLIFVTFILFIVLFANIVLFLCWVLLTYRANRSGDLGRYDQGIVCLLYTSPSPRDMRRSRMPSSA